MKRLASTVVYLLSTLLAAIAAAAIVLGYWWFGVFVILGSIYLFSNLPKELS